MMKIQELSAWHRQMIDKLLAADFTGKIELANQIFSASFEIADENGSLFINPTIDGEAPLIKTIPVEAFSEDIDGAEISVLLFTSFDRAKTLEILRIDGEPVQKLPPVEEFTVMVLGV